MNKSNLLSKGLSVGFVITFILNILLSGYIVSLHKKKINNDVFTISQSLAFGNEIALVVLILIAFIILGFLVYYRKKSNIIMVITLFLLLVACVFLITIVWITIFKNEKAHYIFAAIAFLCSILIVTLTSYSLWTGNHDKKLYEKIIILLVPIITVLSLIGAGVGFLLPNKTIGGRIFASFEIIFILCICSSVLSLGFI
jgi:hypothetical protein